VLTATGSEYCVRVAALVGGRIGAPLPLRLSDKLSRVGKCSESHIQDARCSTSLLPKCCSDRTSDGHGRQYPKPRRVSLQSCSAWSTGQESSGWAVSSTISKRNNILVGRYDQPSRGTSEMARSRCSSVARLVRVLLRRSWVVIARPTTAPSDGRTPQPQPQPQS
jgi:hypothetical protein